MQEMEAGGITFQRPETGYKKADDTWGHMMTNGGT